MKELVALPGALKSGNVREENVRIVNYLSNFVKLLFFYIDQ